MWNKTKARKKGIYYKYVTMTELAFIDKVSLDLFSKVETLSSLAITSTLRLDILNILA